MNYQVQVAIDGVLYKTLADIVPERGPMRRLIVAKTPAPISVEKGHYFQGKQGQMFWKKLRDYELIRTPDGEQPDDFLLDHGFGITDIVKIPRAYGSEPSEAEYRAGLSRILQLIRELKPQVLMFVYKRVLDQVLSLSFGHRQKSIYGFNQDLDRFFGSRVFAFPMPGTPCSATNARRAMAQLQQVMHVVPTT